MMKYNLLSDLKFYITPDLKFSSVFFAFCSILSIAISPKGSNSEAFHCFFSLFLFAFATAFVIEFFYAFRNSKIKVNKK
jgi:hypothetical protein